MTTAILVLFLLAAAGLVISRDALFPPVLFCVLWCGILLLYNGAASGGFLSLIPLSGLTLFIICAGSVGFLAGGLLWLGLNGRPGPVREPVSMKLHAWADRLLYWLPVMGVPVLLWKAVSLFQSQQHFPDFYDGLRFALTELGVQDYGPLEYLVPVAVLNGMYRLFRMESGRTPRVVGEALVSFLLLLFYLVMMTSRTHFLFMLLLYAGFSVWRGGIQRLLRSMAVPLVLVAGGVLVTVLLGKGGTAVVAYMPEESVGHLSWYLLGPTRLLDHLLVFSQQTVFGPLEQGVQGWLLQFVGLLQETHVETVRMNEFYLPFYINVDTLFYGLMRTGGLLGVFLLPLVCGFIHTGFYGSAKAGRFGGRLGYGLLLFPLAMSFFANLYAGLVPMWLQYVLLYMLFFVVFRQPGEADKQIPARGEAERQSV